MRAMPNMLIASPGDPMEVRACVRYIINSPSPSYLRLGKAGEPNFHRSVPDIQPGKWVPISPQMQNREKAILTTGGTLEIASQLMAAGHLRECVLYTLPLWGMRSKVIQYEQALSYSEVITVEDHLIDGGFGSWLMESLHGTGYDLNKIKIKALSEKICGMVGKQATLNRAGGLI